MKIGAIIPVRNCLPYIENCLTTVKAQLYPTNSYLVDDASDDGTYEFLLDRPEWYTKLKRNTVRLGWPETLNRAAQLAITDGCDAVFVMNADDFLRLDCIQKCVEALPGHDWVTVYCQQVGGENVVQISKEDAVLEDFLEYPPLVNQALITREAWEAVGGYSDDVTLPGSWGYKEDWDFWIKLFKAGFNKYVVIKEPVYYYLMHEGQLHESGLSRQSEARELVLKKHNLLTE